MPHTLVQKAVGSCDFVDVLEEAATTGLRTDVKLKDGAAFSDHVTDVITENHSNFAVFRTHGRVAVDKIASATRAFPERRDT